MNVQKVTKITNYTAKKGSSEWKQTKETPNIDGFYLQSPLNYLSIHSTNLTCIEYLLPTKHCAKHSITGIMPYLMLTINVYLM